MSKMTENKISLFLYLSLLVLFIFLSVDFYLKKDDYGPSSDAFLDNPSEYTQKKTEFTGSVINISSDSFYMRVNQRPLKVYYSGLETPKFGQVYVLAELNKDGTAKGLEVHNLSYNYAKYIISFFALIIFLFIFLNEWKFKVWRFVEYA